VLNNERALASNNSLYENPKFAFDFCHGGCVLAGGGEGQTADSRATVWRQD
jgi:hypothetical protein